VKVAHTLSKSGTGLRVSTISHRKTVREKLAKFSDLDGSVDTHHLEDLVKTL
jgi:hypothetical protein